MGRAAVAHTLRVAFQGSVPTKIVREGEEIDFRLQISKKGFKNEVEALKGIQVRNERGRLLDLLPLVKFREVRGKTVIRHYNGKPAVTISSDLDEKVASSKEIKKLLYEKFKGQIEGTPGLQVIFGGEEKATEESIRDFAFPFGRLFIFRAFSAFYYFGRSPLAGGVGWFSFDLPLSFLGVLSY